MKASKPSWKSRRISPSAVHDALAASDGNVTKAAEALGLARETLSRWLHHRPQFRREAKPTERTPAPSRKTQPAFPLDVILDGPRPGREDAERDAAWREVRRDVYAALTGGRFDPRWYLEAVGRGAGAEFLRDRYAFLTERFTNDPRVQTDRGNE